MSIGKKKNHFLLQTYIIMKRKLQELEPEYFYLVVEGVRLKVCKRLLCEKSPVFQTMFESGMNEISTNELIIVDFSMEIVKEFIKCLDKKPNKNSKSIKSYPKELFAIADKYQVMSLIQLIESHMIQSISVDNAITSLQFSDLYNINDLKEASIAIIVANFTSLIRNMNIYETLGLDLCNQLFTHMHKNLKLPDDEDDDTANPRDFRVIVEDCGVKAVNGVYQFIGMKNSAGFFSKTCLCNEEISRIAIYKQPKLGVSMVWCIRLLDFHTDDFDLDGGSTLFYSEPDKNYDSSLPIKVKKWIASRANTTIGCQVPTVRCVK
jgi:hypothetical protein